MVTISQIQASQILDSCGRPTIQVQLLCDNGIITLAHASSNPRSTAIHNHETRDDDPYQYHGDGVQQAITLIHERVAPSLIGQDITQQQQLDQLLQTLDNTPNFANLGTNVVYPISVAIAKAASLNAALPIYRYLNLLANQPPMHIPIPIATMISGGTRGAHNNIDIEEFLIIPQSFPDFASALRAIAEVYAGCRQLLIDSKAILGTSDDGGLSPNLFSNIDAFELIKKAIISSNYILNQQLMLGLRIGAQHLIHEGNYIIRDRTQTTSTAQLLDYYQDLIDRYPLVYLEDPFANDDWSGWVQITQELGSKILVAANDIYASDSGQFNRIQQQGIANALVIIPRLTGTITNTLSLIYNARESGRRIIISSELGDTEDAFIVELAVGTGVDFVKFGAPARGERVSKYNRLQQISDQLPNA